MKAYGYLLTILAAAPVFMSCQEDTAETQAGNTDILVQVKSATDGTATPFEAQINELRVIVQNATTKEWISNSEVRAGVTHFKIYDIPEGSYNFYMIANESAIGMEYTNDKLILDENGKLLFEDKNYQYFPCEASEAETGGKGLLMSWKQLDVKVHKGMAPLTAELRRALCKLNVTIHNDITTDNIIVKSVNFGQFFGTKLYVFGEQTLDVPDQNPYAVFEYTKDGTLEDTIGSGTTKTYSFYAYPSNASTPTNSPYELAIISAKGKYGPVNFIDKYGEVINNIKRNTVLNINAYINTDSSISIDFNVSPWTDETIDVPPFN